MKLTPLAKVFVSVIILIVVGYVVRVRLLHQEGGSVTPATPLSATPPPVDKAQRARFVVGVNDFGGAYPLILANDGAKAGPASAFSKAGLDVEIKLIRGSKERLKAFDDGEVDVMLLTLDYLANLAPIYKQKGTELRSFLLIDWSRGNVGIVAKPGFASIESLKKARVATTRNTPTHYFLLSLLDKSNLSPADIDQVKANLVFANKTPQAGELFQRGEVDAVAIWEPHLSQATEGGKGQALVTTATATNLIADVLFARAAWLKEHGEQVGPFVAAFFDAVAAIGQDPARAIALSAAAFQQKPEEIAATLKKIKPATFADNRAFFGLETEDAPYDRLFLEASRFWQKEGIIKESVEPQATRWLKALEGLAGQHKGEKVVESFQFQAAPNSKAQSLLTKSVSIYFASGQSALDPNARKVIDAFADTLAVFQNAYVRVEGNTDSVGNRKSNIELSTARAAAVTDYLVERHRLDRARFIAVGNGPDAPAADNRTAEGRELNRRTDFKIIKNSGGAAPAPTPAVGEAPTSDNPQVAPAMIQGVIRQKVGALRQCYERELANAPSLAGRIVVRFTIAPGGDVSDSALDSSTMGNARVERCVVAGVQHLRFPRHPGGPVVVKYPFVFQSN